jgi:hypothetical protein
VIEIFAATGARAVATSSADFTRKVDEEARVWKSVVTKAGIKVE